MPWDEGKNKGDSEKGKNRPQESKILRLELVQQCIGYRDSRFDDT